MYLTMTNLILAAIAGLGTICGLILWYVRRKHSQAYKIAKLREKVDEITRTIVALEKQPRTYSRLSRIAKLYDERLQLNREIKYRREAKQGNS